MGLPLSTVELQQLNEGVFNVDLYRNMHNGPPPARAECQYPVLPVGQNFVVDFGRQKALHGKWQIVVNDEAPFYLCQRVFENGTLSRRKSADHRRKFFEREIYLALEKEE